MARALRELLARHADAAIAAAAALAMMATVGFAREWQALERRVFDELTVLTAQGELNQPIALIGISDDALREMKLEWPWPRRLHGDLVTRVAQGGAAVIALDLVFDTPSKDPEDDRLFAQAIAKAGNVVLAADFREQEDALYKMWKLVEPIAPLVEAGALPGRATIAFDADQFVRRIPGEPDAFWRQIIKVLQVKAPSVAVPPLPESGALIRYLGPDTVFDPIPYHLVLQASPEELKTAFDGRIVIVGRELRAAPELGLASSDLFATPFLPSTGTLTAGMKVHATMVDNALSGTWLRALSFGANAAIAVLVAALSWLWMRPWRPLRATLVLLALAALVGALSGYLFAQQRLWMWVATPVAVAVLVYLAYGVGAYLVEQQRKREVQQAFSRYVSPELVEQIVADPKKLALGGEQREITVLFTDLAGFTKLTEKHPPPVVQQVLFRHFTAMTEVILARRGTVVQFIGDAVMAFWGAPLDDPDHALHAVEAAVEMQRAMERLRAELRTQGLPEIHMRIGVNTCEAIVGNMGSSTRLSYTAMGDGVNEASRLEGANKFWKTPILVSGATVAKLGGRIPMRRVDRIRVSGKTEATDVYTPSEDAVLNARTEAAFEAYLERDWDRADRLYAELLLDHESDGVAIRLRERIANWRRAPVEASPDGSMALDKL
jgi:adenylate cyclase